MIIEGIVTTTGPEGGMHVAAMGPWVDEAERETVQITRLVLKPFASSQTAANLVRVPAGVFHVCDDVLLLARIVARERVEIEVRVVAEHVGRPFLGFHRAAHAVVEAAILVTRLHILGPGEVGRQLAHLRPLVEKTGGPREREAFAVLEARLAGG